MGTKVGMKVILKRGVLGNSEGTVGYVFHTYPDYDGLGKGAEIIFPNGEYDGFSVKEQTLYLEMGEVVPVYADYVFTNVMQVMRDFHSNYWKW